MLTNLRAARTRGRARIRGAADAILVVDLNIIDSGMTVRNENCKREGKGMKHLLRLEICTKH